MTIQTRDDILGLMAIGRIVRGAIEHMAAHMAPGMTTAEMDAIGAAYLKRHGARSAPILAYKFPGATCISINDEAAHGIPGPRVIQPGDMVNIDVSAEKDGYWADAGQSYALAPVAEEKQKLITATNQALEIALQHARAGQPINKLGQAVEKHARGLGYQVIEELGGHGVGRHIHEKPSVPMFYVRRYHERFQKGQVLTLEPFLTHGARHVYTLDDGWTLKTDNGGLVAQAEQTIIITDDAPIIVTAAA